jgi:hypothetical protein
MLRKECEMEEVKAENAKLEWQPMKLSNKGNVRDIVQIGGGKLSAVGGDPGEPRKPKGQG